MDKSARPPPNKGVSGTGNYITEKRRTTNQVSWRGGASAYHRPILRKTKMTDNEFLLHDRLTKIKSVIGKYGEENFSISFSCGKDSTVLSSLIDMALPGNKIPRVYANTGIEYRLILDFVER